MTRLAERGRVLKKNERKFKPAIHGGGPGVNQRRRRTVAPGTIVSGIDQPALRSCSTGPGTKIHRRSDRDLAGASHRFQRGRSRAGLIGSEAQGLAQMAKIRAAAQAMRIAIGGTRGLIPTWAGVPAIMRRLYGGRRGDRCQQRHSCSAYAASPEANTASARCPAIQSCSGVSRCMRSDDGRR